MSSKSKKKAFVVIKSVDSKGSKRFIKDPPVKDGVIDLSKLPKNSEYTITVFK